MVEERLHITSIGEVHGEIVLPGSKSLSHRALLFAAVAQGESLIDQLLNSDDVNLIWPILTAFGVKYWRASTGDKCVIYGQGRPLQAVQPTTLFLGNAGTALRLLTALLSLKRHCIIITGDAYMQRRPIDHLVDALRQGGAEINYCGREGCPPLQLHGGFQGGEITIRGNYSSQFLSALLMAAPMAPNDSVITVVGELVSHPYVAMTLHLMQRWGVTASCDQDVFHITGRQRYRAVPHFVIEGDATAASYFLAAAAIKGGDVRVVGFSRHTVQGEAGFISLLEAMGTQIVWDEQGVQCTRGALQGITCDVGAMPDSALTLAIVALFAKGPTRLYRIHHWRFKESNRLLAMATILRQVGAQITTGYDFISITPPQQFKAATIHSYADHRIAMCAALLALSGQPITIIHPHCITKSFPDYFAQLRRLNCQVTPC